MDRVPVSVFRSASGTLFTASRLVILVEQRHNSFFNDHLSIIEKSCYTLAILALWVVTGGLEGSFPSIEQNIPVFDKILHTQGQLRVNLRS